MLFSPLVVFLLIPFTGKDKGLATTFPPFNIGEKLTALDAGLGASTVADAIVRVGCGMGDWGGVGSVAGNGAIGANVVLDRSGAGVSDIGTGAGGGVEVE